MQHTYEKRDSKVKPTGLTVNATAGLAVFGDELELLDRDCCHCVSGLGSRIGVRKSRRGVAAQELPDGPDVDDATALLAKSPYGHHHHALDSVGRVLSHGADGYEQDPRVDRAFEVVDVLERDPASHGEPTRDPAPRSGEQSKMTLPQGERTIPAPPNFPARGMHHRPVFGSVVSSHSVPRLGAVSRVARVRRAAHKSGAGAHPLARVVLGRRMRRKAAHTCNANQEAYSSPSSRCSR
jgi:hypothetical protein